MGKRLALTAVVLAVIAAGAVAYYRTRAGDMPTLVTTTLIRGDVVETVDATGTLQAVTTVQVGTQVSGTIKALRADFNSRVRRGDVIAELEPALFKARSSRRAPRSCGWRQRRCGPPCSARTHCSGSSVRGIWHSGN